MQYGGSKKVTEYYQARSAKIRNACLVAIAFWLVAFSYLNRQELGHELQRLSKASVARLATPSGNH